MSVSADNVIHDNQLDELIARMREAASAYIRGDVRRYFALFDHPNDYSLMPRTAVRRWSVSTGPMRNWTS